MEHLIIPAWSKKRRILTALVGTVFILLTSSFIGYGVYYSGVRSGRIDPPLNKDTLLQSLLTDPAFNQAVKKTVNQKLCENTKQKFYLSYESPLHPVTTTGDDACLVFTTTHPTGTLTTITFSQASMAREDLAAKLAKEFRFVQTDTIPGTYETTQLSGVKQEVPTTIFLLKVSPQHTWVATYSPTSPVIDGKILAMIEQFRVY